MIYMNINLSDFRDAFNQAGRSNAFSYKGFELLFNYFEEASSECNIELDVIAICCEYSEYGWDDIADNYRIDLSKCDLIEEKIDAVREYLEEHTLLIGETYEGTFLYADF